MTFMELSKLKPYSVNNKIHEKAQIEKLAKSIQEFGWTNDILVDENLEIIAGHKRYLAALHLGMTEAPVKVLSHLTEAQKKSYRIIDNKTTQESAWDLENLKIEIEELKNLEFDLTKFIDVDFFGEEEEPEVIEDEVPQIQEQAISKLGDIWLLGNHRLLCGDSTLESSYIDLMQGKKADMVFTDPPYNVDYTGKTKDALKISNDKMSNDSFRDFLFEFYKRCAESTRKGGAIYVCHADSEGYNFRGAFVDSGFLLKQTIIWLKNTIVMGRQDYHWQHEPILYGWLDGASHTWRGDRKQSTVWECNKPSRSEQHPTMKPLELISIALKNSSIKNELILDPFLGSGSTLIACEQLDRVCYGIELEPKYCDVIINRWQNFTNKEAICEKTGKTFKELNNNFNNNK